MSGRNAYRASPPQKLFENYKDIVNSNLIRNKELSDENIAEFEYLLNQAQPQNDEEHCMRSFIQYLYRKNPGHFTRFIQRSSLNQLALWTEAKFMVRTFELRGLVYVKWDIENGKYVCSMHRTVSEYLDSGECSSMEEVVDRITRETENQDRENRGSRLDFDNDRDRRGKGGRGKGGRGKGGRGKGGRGKGGRDQRSNYGECDDTRSQLSNYRGNDNRQTRDSNFTNYQYTPTENDFPVLASKHTASQKSVCLKRGDTNTTEQLGDDSTSDATTVDLTASGVFDAETEL
jgi:hypothetical protein